NTILNKNKKLIGYNTDFLASNKILDNKLKKIKSCLLLGNGSVAKTIYKSLKLKKIKNIFTKVLKGHIAVATTDINKDDIGKKIDKRARKFLNKSNLDYAHGTGHGVGFFLNVHEGPQAISKNNNIKIREGMILSNEPGFYRKNKFGIRIENLIYVKKNKKKLFFENLTLAPID
ncbi:MAG: M24 family metallopeptidase, partial [Paracoccaceae bacterium]|nr:M24 family metallopeptidase [Paracoccaceae bacterium]